MISEKLVLLKTIREEATAEEGYQILFKNLEILQLLQRNKFIEIANETLGQPTVEQRKSEIKTDPITLEEFVNFVTKEPAIDIKALSNMNVQLSIKESLKFPNFDTRKPLFTFGTPGDRDMHGSAAYESKLKDLEDEIERQAGIIEHFEIEFANLTKENRMLKEIINKCKSCRNTFEEIIKENQMSDEKECKQNEEGGEDKQHKKGVVNSDLEQQIVYLQHENQEFKTVLEQSNSKLEMLTHLNSELEQKLKLFFNENQDVQTEFSNIEEAKADDVETCVLQKLHQTGPEDDLQKIYEHVTDVGELQNMIKELIQERTELQEQLADYEEEEELVAQEVEHHRRTLEETQQYIEDFRKTYENKLANLEQEKEMMSQELINAQNELERAKIALEESGNPVMSLQIKKLELTRADNRALQKMSHGNDEKSVETDEVEAFIELFNVVFQELVNIDFREFLETHEDPLTTQVLEFPLEVKLARIKSVILRFFEMRDRLNVILTERDALLSKLETTMPDTARTSHSTDQSKTQLLFELNEATAALDQKQEELKEMREIIKGVEYERDTLYQQLEELRAAGGKISPRNTQAFDWLDGMLEPLFTEEEIRSMSTHQKVEEVHKIIREYQSLREHFGELNEEKGLLQVTLDSVTNKLRAQQSEIDYLNRQIDVMRNEVASFLKMDEFKSVEKMKTENAKLKQENEALKVENEQLKNELSQEKLELKVLRNEKKELIKTIEERANAIERLEKEFKVINANLSEKINEIDTIGKQLKELKQKHEETTKLLENEREGSRKKDLDLRETQRQLHEFSSQFEKASLLLEQERNENSKKERNLNDLIQQVSQLLEKNEKMNDQLLQEKEKTRKVEESLADQQKRNQHLSERVDALSQKLEEEKRKRKDQDKFTPDLKREGSGANVDNFDRTRSQTHIITTEIERSSQKNSEKVTSEGNDIIKLLGKDSVDIKAREQAIVTLKADFAALLEQNKRLSQAVEELNCGANKSQTRDSLNQQLRSHGLLVPEKFFTLKSQAEQIEALAKGFDKLERERRKLAGSLEAQKDDSTAKEYVISSLKDQNIALIQSHETLSKIRGEIFGMEGDKKDAVRRLEAIKSYFSKNPKLDRAFKRDFSSAEQELIKQKDSQLLELHDKIQKLLGEFQLRGWENHPREVAPDTKSSQNPNEETSSQLDQMMKMMTHLINAKNEQSLVQDSQLEEENRKLKSKLENATSMIRTLLEKLKTAIAENKILKQKLQTWLKACIEGIETEIKILQATGGATDYTKVTEFLQKLSKKLANTDKNMANFGVKEEQIKKQFNALLEEIGTVDGDESLVLEDSPRRERLSEEGFMEMTSKGRKTTKKEMKQQVVPDNTSQDEDSEDEEITFPQREESIFSNIIKAPHQEKVKSSGLTQTYGSQTSSHLQNYPNISHQQQYQQSPRQYQQSSQHYQQLQQSYQQQHPTNLMAMHHSFSQQAYEPQDETFIRNRSPSQLTVQQNQIQSSNISQHNMSKRVSTENIGVQESNVLQTGTNRFPISLQKLGQVAESRQVFANPYLQAYRPDMQNLDNYESPMFQGGKPVRKTAATSGSKTDRAYYSSSKEPEIVANLGYRQQHTPGMTTDTANTTYDPKNRFYFGDSKQNYSQEIPVQHGSHHVPQPSLQDHFRQSNSFTDYQVFKKDVSIRDPLHKKGSITVFDASFNPRNEYGYDSNRMFKSRLKETSESN